MSLLLCFASYVMQDLTDSAWQQAQLSLKYGGLGLRPFSLHSCAAYIASVCATGRQDIAHLIRPIDTFNALVSPEDTVTLDSIVSPPVHQTTLSSSQDLQCFRSLLNISSLANKARLLLASAPHASSWLTVVPTVELGVHLDPSELGVHLDPSELGVHLDPSELGVHLDPSELGVHLDPSELGVHLDPSELGVHLDPSELGVHLDPSELGVHLDPSELGVHLDPSEFSIAIRWWLGVDTSGGFHVLFAMTLR